MTESDEQVRLQRAIGDAHAAWVKRWDGKIPHSPPTHDGDTDYPEHHLVVDAEGEAHADLRRSTAAAITSVTGRPSGIRVD